jgi:hypothetical protein
MGNETKSRQLKGYVGEFGAGGGGKIVFLQSAISTSQLEWLSLVSEIEGSEQWPVRDLFQREVDSERVRRDIVPWLEDDSAVKFFSPLTLAVLPFDPATNRVRHSLSLPERKVVAAGEKSWQVVELAGCFRFSSTNVCHGYGTLTWDSARAKIVAVDGQHRLAALREFVAKSGNERIHNWSIPVVICGLFRESAAVVPASLLEVIRNIFVYINTKANPPSQTRQILLDDQSVNNVAVQEVLEYSHQRDVQGLSHNADALPLLFFDWRGATEGGEPILSPTAVKSAVEVRDWMSHYILGEDRTLQQLRALGIPPDSQLADQLERPFIDSEAIAEVRTRFRSRWLRAVEIVLRDFVPYNRYITHLRRIERELQAQPGSGVHVLAKLRFGTHQGLPHEETAIAIRYEQVIDEITDLKHDIIPELMRLDIGMRSVLSAFRTLHGLREVSQSAPLEDYAQWFVGSLNRAYSDDWFVRYGIRRRFLKHVCLAPSDTVVNYRLRDIPDAYGALLTVVLAAHSYCTTGWPPQREWDQMWTAIVERRLLKRVLKGNKTEARAALRESYSDKHELKREVERLAERRTRQYAKELGVALTQIKDM